MRPVRALPVHENATMQVKTMVINSSVSVTVMYVKQITRYGGDVYTSYR